MILLGEGASATGTDEGQIVLGSVANHTSCRISGLLLDGSGYALGCQGFYHVSGVGDDEVRHIVIHRQCVRTIVATVPSYSTQLHLDTVQVIP